MTSAADASSRNSNAPGYAHELEKFRCHNFKNHSPLQMPDALTIYAHLMNLFFTISR